MVSLIEYFLLKMSSMAKQHAESTSTNERGSKVAPVGLKMSMQPMKPPMLASQRSLPTVSPKIILAKAILKKGMVLLTTTQEAKGIRLRPRHQRPMPSAKRAPRTKCIQRRSVLKAAEPWEIMNGKSTTAAKEKRRKTIWKGGKLPPKNFMMASLPMPTTKWLKYHEMPVMYLLLAEGATTAAAAAAAATKPLEPRAPAPAAGEATLPAAPNADSAALGDGLSRASLLLVSAAFEDNLDGPAGAANAASSEYMGLLPLPPNHTKAHAAAATAGAATDAMDRLRRAPRCNG
mmetsp:Transcript_99510/g.252835  ORF Transcript_99510/g.252835 Transcript_99510/m.252835 type:complete len:290 (-) Transcript_99510:54-923(-)